MTLWRKSPSWIYTIISFWIFANFLPSQKASLLTWVIYYWYILYCLLYVLIKQHRSLGLNSRKLTTAFNEHLRLFTTIMYLHWYHSSYICHHESTSNAVPNIFRTWTMCLLSGYLRVILCWENKQLANEVVSFIGKLVSNLHIRITLFAKTVDNSSSIPYSNLIIDHYW